MIEYETKRIKQFAERAMAYAGIAYNAAGTKGTNCADPEEQGQSETWKMLGWGSGKRTG